MKLNLKNPLIFFDLETTGLNITNDRIVEISYLKVHPNGVEESKTMRINPCMNIPASSSAVHGIYDEDVKDCPIFKDVAAMIAKDFAGADIAGYNSNNFDVPFLAEEFLRAGAEIDLAARKMIDVQVVFHKMEQRTLSAAYKFYCDKDLVNAHSASADTMATYEILMAQLDKYPELDNDVNYLAKFTQFKTNADLAGKIGINDKGVEVFNFGKYKGQSVADVFAKDSGYYGWCINADFPLTTKRVLTKIKLRSAHSK